MHGRAWSTTRSCVTRSTTATGHDGPMSERPVPDEHGVVEARPDRGGGAATPSFALPAEAGTGIPGVPDPVAIGPRTFYWGARTYLMGILNVTPDSFSGDGLLAAGDPVAAAVNQASRMVDEGADLLDIGGASRRPRPHPLPPAEGVRRVVPVVEALAAALPGTVVSVDTTSPAVAEAALDAGAHLLNDVWGVT